MKKLKDEDDLVLLDKLRKLNTLGVFSTIVLVIELLLFKYLWLEHRVLFWIGIILCVIYIISTSVSLSESKCIKVELEKRGLTK